MQRACVLLAAHPAAAAHGAAMHACTGLLVWASTPRRVALTRWVGKVAALLFCSFSEVLLLDADNTPLADPTPLFDDALYRQHGNLFWPDMWADWVNPGVHPFLGLDRARVQVRKHARTMHT
jgi:hypothetical protein